MPDNRAQNAAFWRTIAADGALRQGAREGERARDPADLRASPSCARAQQRAAYRAVHDRAGEEADRVSQRGFQAEDEPTSTRMLAPATFAPLVYRPLLSLALLALGIAGCRIVASSEVQLPSDGPTYLVKCNYEFRNCKREAERQCKGRFEQLTRKNCPRCDKKLQLPATPEKDVPQLRPGYRGTLYYRCR